MDLEAIKAQIDLRTLVEHDLGKPKIHSAKANLYPCPFHHEHKGYSLAVYQDGWKCFGKCNTGGDVFSWVKQRQGYQNFAEVLAYLGYTPDGIQRRKTRMKMSSASVRPVLEAAQPPDERWQFYAGLVVEHAESNLWSPEGARALDYLHNRGLRDYVIREARLGYIPAETSYDYQYGQVFDCEWQVDGKQVKVHCGITIPHFAQGHLWAVRTRRPPGLDGPKYVGIRGGSKALYWSDQIEPRLPVLLTEGEFDALVVWQEAGPGCDVEVCPVALGSASNKHLAPNWLESLVAAPVILSRMDDDQAGDSANTVLQQLSARVHPVAVPGVKDITDLHLTGPGAVRAWVEGVLG